MTHPKDGAERIAAERKRQIKEEGWKAEHDDAFTHSELVNAAICYALREGSRRQKYARADGVYKTIIDHFWPWDIKYWKPTPDNRIRELEKAGALIAAEIDRILRGGKA